jgi:hypothetical protein
MNAYLGISEKTYREFCTVLIAVTYSLAFTKIHNTWVKAWYFHG